MDDLLNAGPRRRRRIRETFGTSSAAKGGSAPYFTVAHQLRAFHRSLQKANGPVTPSDPEPLPRRSIGPPTGARGSIYPRRGPTNTDDPSAAINPPQPKVGK